MSTYFLNPDHTVRECTLEEWSSQHEDMRLNHTITLCFTELNNKAISTVWIGIDLNFLGNKPLLFETMVFQGGTGGDIYTDRYSTWDEALVGHQKAIEWVKAGCSEDEL